MSLDRTLRGLIASGRDDAVAIAAHDAPPLDYAALRALIDRSVRSLNDLGIGRGDRVAIVLPNGPEMATAFLCVASAAASAPLNPAYKQDEFEFYLEDLKAKALIVEAGSASPALRAAEKLGVKLITLTPEPRPARARSGSPARRWEQRPDPDSRRRRTSPSSCTRRAPPRGRKSCRWRTPTSGIRRATSPLRSSFRPTTARSMSCPCSTFTG